MTALATTNQARDAGFFHAAGESEPEDGPNATAGRQLYIGLMSGTSLDGVDGVLVDFIARDGLPLQVLGHAHEAFAPQFADELLALNTTGGNELHRAALAANALARACASVVDRLLAARPDLRPTVRAIGAHGQTVRHAPGQFDGVGYTLQLNNPALLAELTGIDVVADFRSRDVAARGQGAPLAPAFHRAVFGRHGETVAVLNIGGIANLSVIGADGSTIGFDCGPGNALMDGWCREHIGTAFDDRGAWAASGRSDDALLARLMATPYFAVPPPKSTGRDLFHAGWLQAQLAAPRSPALAPVDVQATLAEFTAAACAADTLRHARGARELIVCGGGAYNQHLLLRLAAHLPGVNVVSSAEHDLPPSQVEACAFAWLAKRFGERRPGNIDLVTGARGPRLLGALYPAG